MPFYYPNIKKWYFIVWVIFWKTGHFGVSKRVIGTKGHQIKKGTFPYYTRSLATLYILLFIQGELHNYLY
jgi:hypothetical protein